MANTLFILLTNDNLIQALTDADVAKIAKLIKIEKTRKKSSLSRFCVNLLNYRIVCPFSQTIVEQSQLTELH